MRPEFYRQQWQTLQAAANPEGLQHLAEKIARSFVDHYFFSDNYEAQYLNLLCEMALAFDEESQSGLNGIATNALFGIVIEQLCDDFEELQTETYNRVMSQIIANILKHPAGKTLREPLERLKLTEQQQLYNRVEAIRSNSDKRRVRKTPPKKIAVLSRVTIGADVAISSVLCQRLHQQFPDAEIILIGPQKLHQLYAQNASVRIVTLNYSRRGGLIGRFNAWLALSEIISLEKGELNDQEFLIFDPDSRLSQLGILPLVASDSYYYFNSRGKESYPKKIPIAELSNFWLDSVIGPGRFCYPGVWPANTTMDIAKHAAQQLTHQGINQIISINFGVGGNPRKQLSYDFEEQLILTLLKEPHTAIFMDLGFGDEETQRSQQIVDTVQSQGHAATSIVFQDLVNTQLTGGLIGVECEIGEIAALIAYSNEFIGYDSACQHMAAGLNIPTYTIFAGTSNVRFIRRWTACGPNVSEIIYVDNESKNIEIDSTNVVERIMDRRS